MSQRAAQFRADGYVVLPGLAAAAEVEVLRDAVEAAPERDGVGDNPLSLGAMRFRSNLFHGSEALQAFLSSPKVCGVVAELLAPDAWVRWDQAVWKGPGGPAFPLHQDNGYTGLAATHLQLWIALTPMTQANGGLVVVPGAHREALAHEWVGDHVRTEVDGERVAIDAEPGDAVAFSSFLPHATTPNETDRTRLAYVAEFLPADERDEQVRGPYFLAVEGGRSAGRFVDDLASPGPAPAPRPAPRSRWRLGGRRPGGGR